MPRSLEHSDRNRTGHDTLPNFLIVGAAKSGTTSLYHYLREHPDVFMPFLKEPGFLTAPEPYGRVRTIDQYHDLFEDAHSETAIGEASPIYLPDPNAPGRIEDVLGRRTKIIIVLRNPIDMVHSLWAHRHRQGREERDFRPAIEASLELYGNGDVERAVWALKNPTSVSTYPYIYQARYSPQVERYQHYFSHCKVLIFEEVFDQVDEFYREICRFLEVDDSFTPEFRQYNQAGETWSKLLRRLITEESILKEVLKNVVGWKTREKMKKYLVDFNTNYNGRGGMKDGSRRWLSSIFFEDVNNLKHEIGENLNSKWLDFK